jgi:hypothetical protein
MRKSALLGSSDLGGEACNHAARIFSSLHGFDTKSRAITLTGNNITAVQRKLWQLKADPLLSLNVRVETPVGLTVYNKVLAPLINFRIECCHSKNSPTLRTTVKHGKSRLLQVDIKSISLLVTSRETRDGHRARRSSRFGLPAMLRIAM